VNDLNSDKLENHELRMKEILSHSDRFNANILCYISGYMGNDSKFQEAFKSALEDGILIE
jgi:hypothetical protein